MTVMNDDVNMRELYSDKRIALLLSGGVDSAVAAYMLVQQDIMPDCFYIKIGPEEQKEWNCTSEEDLEIATNIAKHYGLHLNVIDCHEEYWSQVVDYTMSKVRSGFTPNPDVLCNTLIKFGAFHVKKGYEYDIIATGHYAVTETDSEGRRWLCTCPDAVKDQTDFLAQLLPWQLQKALFPIGHMTKDEVRHIATREKMINAQRKDSQGICFLGKINYNDYLRRYLGESIGDIIEWETGSKIGEHRGLWFHTIGQRKGLGLSGGPWFVVHKDMSKNILYVSHGYAPAEVYRQEFTICDIHWLTAPLLFDADGKADVTFKIRHTSDYYHAQLETCGDGTYIVHAERKIHGVAQGQFCVLYDTAHHRCYGSAEIAPQPF